LIKVLGAFAENAGLVERQGRFGEPSLALTIEIRGRRVPVATLRHFFPSLIFNYTQGKEKLVDNPAVLD
jgi:hypothetical protein